jgi:hypothetical protein
MDKKFAAFVDTLAPKLTQLLEMPPLKYWDLPLDIPPANRPREPTSRCYRQG